MVQTDAELLTVGELKNIGKGIVIGFGRLILSNNGDIIGMDLAIQPLAALHAVSENETGILTGNVPALGINVERRSCHIHGGMIGDGEGELHDRAVGDPCFNTELCGAGRILIVEDLYLHQVSAQPNCHISALAHDLQFHALITGVQLSLFRIQGVDGLPVEDRIIAGMLCILQDELVAFLQHVNVPVLAVAEQDPHAGSLLQVQITLALLSQLLIVLQLHGVGEVVEGGIAHHMAAAAHLVQGAIILIIHDEAGAGSVGEEIIFQKEIGINVLIQTNTAGDGNIAFLLNLQDIVTLLHIGQFESALLIDGHGLFTLGAGVGNEQAFQIILHQAMESDLAAEGLVAIGNRFCLGRNIDAFNAAADHQSNASVLIVGHALDLLFAVDQNGSQRIAFVGLDGDNGLHAGKHGGVAGKGAILALLQRNGNRAPNAIAVKAEILGHIGKLNAVLLNIVIPVSVKAGVRTAVVKGGDVSGVDQHVAVLHVVHIDTQPLQVLPGDKQLQIVAVALGGIYVATLGGCGQNGHLIIGGGDIGIAIRAVTLSEVNVAGRHQVDLKEAVMLYIDCIGGCQVHLDTAVHNRAAIQIDIDGNAFRYIVNEIHTLLAIMAGHSDADIVAGIVIVQIQPIVVLVSFLIQDTVKDDVGIRFSLGYIGILKGISIFCRVAIAVGSCI